MTGKHILTGMQEMSGIVGGLKCAASAIAIFLVAASQASFAQQLPPPIEQPAVDEFGVEIKSGRYGALSVPLIAIGGEGASRITRTYAPQDGREMIAQSIFNIQTSLVYLTNTSPTGNYDYVTVTYSGGSLRFRRPSGSGTAYSAEFATGATYDANGVFTDKYGVRIEGDKISYPDGREIWGGTRASGVGAIYQTIPVLKNNFGFALVSKGSSSDVSTQAVNLALDYCDVYGTNPCSNLQAVKSARVQKTSSTETQFTDASSGITRVVFEPQDAFYDPPNCYISSGGWTCTGYKYVYNYPKYIYYPGSTNPDVSINYLRYGEPQSVEHHEILIDSLNSRGTSVSYISSSVPNGSAGGGQSGSQIYVNSLIGGSYINRSRASSYTSAWGTPGLVLNTVENALGRITSFGYNQKGDVASISSPEGNSRILSFDTRFNVTQVIERAKAGSGAADLITTYEYSIPCSASTQTYCNLPSAMIDPRGGRTEYLYNTKGQVTQITGPAPAVGQPRPITRNTYTMRTAYIRDASGGVVPAGSPISLLTRTSQCRTSESCAGTADEVVTDYDYGPTTGANNLLLRGIAVTAADATGALVTLRTCYQYNYFGEKIAETQPQANLASCQ